MAAYTVPEQVNVHVGRVSELARGQLVSGNFFQTLGVGAALGRALTPGDDRPGAPPAAVVSHAFWQRVFGGDTGILGRDIAVNGAPATIVGITPPGFCSLNQGPCVDVMVPLVPFQPAFYVIPGMLQSSGHWAFSVIGRLKPGATDAGVAGETEALLHQAVLAARPTSGANLPRLVIGPGGQGLGELRRRVVKPLRVMMAFVAIVLLIACANIAGLLLTRATARQRELRCRLALGASRGELARQLLTESLLLSAAGGAVGVAVAFALRHVLPRALAEGSEPLQVDVEPGAWMLLFSTGICAAAGVLCGVLPALGGARVSLVPAFGRGSTGADVSPHRFWTGKALVVVQVALSILLLVGAGLFVRTLANLRREALGFRPEHLLLFQMDASTSGYKDGRLHDFYEEAVRRVAQIPGVTSASISRWGVLAGARTTDNISTAREAGSKATGVHVHYVAPRYFATMGVPLLRGRDVAWTDRDGAPRVAVANQAFARRFFGGAETVGQRFGFGGPESVNEIEIVGVAGDARFTTLREPAPPTVYIPFRQNPQHLMTFAVRTPGEPQALVDAIRRTLAALDSNVPMFEVRSQTRQIDQSVQQERLFAHLLTAFASLAVALACIGIYGTLAYWVARRTPEIGIRMALGADRARVVRMVVEEMAVPVLVGVGLGLASALGSTRVLASLLFGLTPRDATSMATAAAILLSSAGLAIWLPSRRASRLDPTVALREE